MATQAMTTEKPTLNLDEKMVSAIEELWAIFLKRLTPDLEQPEAATGVPQPAISVPDFRDPNSPAPLPFKLDIQTVAGAAGYKLKLGGADPESQNVINIPVAYSSREERVAVAKFLARIAITEASALCIGENGEHSCPSNDLCELLTKIQNGSDIDIDLAAGLLLKKDDFKNWHQKMGGDEYDLAQSYSVPVTLVRRRVEQLGLRRD